MTKMTERRSTCWRLTALLLAYGVFLAINVQAATFEVTNGLDGPMPGPEGSLRWAVHQANQSEGTDTISISESVEEIVLNSQINVLDPATIQSFRTGGTTISLSEGTVARFFAFESDDPEALQGGLTLINLLLFGGRTMQDATDLSTCSSSTGQGGAICSQGRLSLIDMRLFDNGTSGTGAAGGAVWADGFVLLRGSEVLANSTQGLEAPGGGVYADRLTCLRSQVGGNETNGDNSPGGGLHIVSSVQGGGCDVYLNVTSGDLSGGGGVFAEDLSTLFDAGGWILRANQTTGASSHGGGALVADLSLLNSTVSDNGINGEVSSGSGIMLIARDDILAPQPGAPASPAIIASSTFLLNSGDAALVIDDGANENSPAGFEVNLLLANSYLDASIYQNGTDSILFIEAEEGNINVIESRPNRIDVDGDPGWTEVVTPFVRQQNCLTENGVPDGNPFCHGGFFPLRTSPLVDAGGSSLFTVSSFDGRGPGYSRRADGRLELDESPPQDIGAIELSPIIDYFLATPFSGLQSFIAWSTPDEVFCLREGLQGTEWEGEGENNRARELVVDLRTLSEFPSALPATIDISLTCESLGEIQIQSYQLRIPLDISIEEFVVEPASTFAGNTVDISWQAFPSLESTQCFGEGLEGTDWDEFSGDGDGNISVDTTSLTPGTYEVELRCVLPDKDDEGVRVQQSATVQLEVLGLPAELDLQASIFETSITDRQLATLEVTNGSQQDAVDIVLTAITPENYQLNAGYRLAPLCNVDPAGSGEYRCDIDQIPDWQCSVSDNLTCTLDQLPVGGTAAVVVEFQGDGTSVLTGSVSAANADEVTTQLEINN